MKILSRFEGTENIANYVNDFVAEQEICEYEVVGFQTYFEPSMRKTVTSILIEYDESETKEYKNKKREEQREIGRLGLPY